MSAHLFVLYDERARYSVDDASVLSTARSLREAREDKRTMFPGAVIYQYDDDDSGVLANAKVIT